MTIQHTVDKFFEHWTRKLSTLILAYLAIVTLVLKVIYPYLNSVYPSTWSKYHYILFIIVPYVISIALYFVVVYQRNKITSIKHVLDIFPTYASFIRVLVGLALVISGLIMPNLRSLSISYIIVIMSVGFLSLTSLYYDIAFRFIRVLVDIFLAALIVYYYGGINSPFVILFFIPTTVAARYFDEAPSRCIAALSICILFFITFIDLSSETLISPNSNSHIALYITISLLIFLIGEMIYAERRERINPIQNSLLKINKICREDGSIKEVLVELCNYLNTEAIVVLNELGEFAVCYNKIGSQEYNFSENVLVEPDHKKVCDWINELDLKAVGKFWDILYNKRKVIVDGCNIFLEPILDKNILPKIISFIFVKLDDEKGYVMAINNKSANKIVAKPFTPDRYELLELSSTVIDDHSFFYNRIIE